MPVPERRNGMFRICRCLIRNQRAASRHSIMPVDSGHVELSASVAVVASWDWIGDGHGDDGRS